MRYFPAIFLATFGSIFASYPGQAGEGQTVEKKGKSVLVELDGSASADEDGDALEYAWRQVSGPRVTLSDPQAAKPFFRTTEPGLYVFELRVSDGKTWSHPVQVEVHVEAENLPPEAIVLPEITCEVGQTAVIDGRRSRDPEGERLSYRWRQVAGPPLYLSAEICRQPVLAFPAAQTGVYEIELLVSDGKNTSQAALCRLIIKPHNNAPVARADSKQRVILPKSAEEKAQATRKPVACIEEVGCPLPGEIVVLDGRNSFSPSRKPLKYYWKQKSGPFVRSFARPEEGVLTFTAEDEGEYEFELIVSDGEQESASTVRKFFVGQEAAAPVAVVMGPPHAKVGEQIVLDGTRSFDRGESELEYLWRQISGPRILHYTLPKANASDVVAFTPQEAGKYVFELVVANGRRKSRPAHLEIDVSEQAPALRAEISAPARAVVGKPICLEAEAEGSQGDISYVWRQVSGPRLLRGPTAQRALLVVPQEAGIYGFEVVAADGETRGQPARVEITVEAAAEDGENLAAEVMTSCEDAVPPGEDGVQHALPAAYRQRIRHIFQKPVTVPPRISAAGARDPDISAAAPPELPPASADYSRRAVAR